MKRFIYSALCASLIFVGVGAIVDKAGAKFKSDEKALELIRQARLAIGGDSAIAGVQSMVIKGTTTRNFKIDGADRAESGETEIAMQLPDKLMKMVKIGHTSTDGKTEKSVEHRVNVIVNGDDKDAKTITVHAGEGIGPGSGAGTVNKKIIVKSADGTTKEMTGAEADKWIAEHHGEVTVNGNPTKRIVVKKDGVTQEMTGADADKWIAEHPNDGANGRQVVIRKVDGGNVEFRTNGEKTVSDDGRNVMIHRVGGEGHHDGMRQNELLRTTLGLLLTAPAGMDVSYTFGGESDIDGTACNIVVADFGGRSYKLYLGKASNLPVMMSYKGMQMPQMVKFDKAAPAPADGGKETVFFKQVSDQVEFQVKFSDYRLTGGVQLPYKWTQTVGGAIDETFDVTNYEINPANIGDRFQHDKTMLRMKKPDSQ